MPYPWLPCPATTSHPILSPDLELLEGLDVSKHGERAVAVTAFVKELENSVHGGRKAADPAAVTVAAV